MAIVLYMRILNENHRYALAQELMYKTCSTEFLKIKKKKKTA